MARSERRIDAPARRVFDALVDAEHYPRWLVGARHVEVRDGRWPLPGSTFEHEVGAGPVEVHDRTSVKAVDPGHTFDLVVRARPFLEADVHFEVHPAGGGGSVVTMEETPRGRFKVLAPVIAPMVKLRNDKSLANLARWIESGGTPKAAT